MGETRGATDCVMTSYGPTADRLHGEFHGYQKQYDHLKVFDFMGQM